MNKKLKKHVFSILAMLLFCCMFLTSCGQKTDGQSTSDNNDTLQNSGISSSSAEVAKINGEVLTASEFQYYIYNTAMMKAYNLDSGFTGDFSSIDWSQKTDTGKTLAEDVKDEALNNAIAEILTTQQGKQNGVEISADEQAQYDQAVDSFIEQSGEEQFKLTANAMAISSADDYKKLYSRMMLVQKVQDDIQKNPDKYITDKEMLKKYKSNDKVTVQHILIMNDSQKQADPKAAINEVLERAKAGEDFYQLMQEFNEDTGETEAGYTFGPGEMVKEFEDAAFALDYDQISDVVESEYGYHVIKRLIGTAELQAYWKENADITQNDSVLKDISVENIVQSAENAQKKLQEQSSASTSSTQQPATDQNGGNTNE